MMSATLWLVTLAALSAPVVFFVWRTWGLLFLNLQVGMNDDSFVQSTFVALLNEAEREMWICDDGNDFPESIYNTAEVVDAVDRRLRDNKGLHVYCLFSSKDDTAFTRAFGDHPQVHMKRGVRPRRDIHFKIIDDSRKGYVSAHPLGSSERGYRSYDCSKVPKHIRHAALGRHRDSMVDHFPERAVV